MPKGWELGHIDIYLCVTSLAVALSRFNPDAKATNVELCLVDIYFSYRK